MPVAPGRSAAARASPPSLAACPPCSRPALASTIVNRRQRRADLVLKLAQYRFESSLRNSRKVMVAGPVSRPGVLVWRAAGTGEGLGQGEAVLDTEDQISLAEKIAHGGERRSCVSQGGGPDGHLVAQLEQYIGCSLDLAADQVWERAAQQQAVEYDDEVPDVLADQGDGSRQRSGTRRDPARRHKSERQSRALPDVCQSGPEVKGGVAARNESLPHCPKQLVQRIQLEIIAVSRHDDSPSGTEC